MRKKYLFFLFVIVAVSCAVCFFNSQVVHADELSDNINEQLDNIDLSGLEGYTGSIGTTSDLDVISFIRALLEGKYELDYTTILNYLSDIFFNKIKELLPVFLNVTAIAVFCGIINSTKGAFLSDGVADVIYFTCFLSVVLILSSLISEICLNTKNVIENMAKLSEIMSPIIITLMVATGGTVSASVYKPAVIFLSNGIINVFLYAVLPLIGINLIFNIISNFSGSLKLKKFSDFATSVIKWIVGIMITVFGIFLSIQGITSASFDGVSIKAAKYTLSNTIPLIGGFLSSGLDLIVAGSILIKNAVGVAVVVLLFYTIISPVLYIAVVSLLLKFVAAITESVSDSKISELCTSVSKSIGYLLVAVLAVGFMLFITVLLMIISANAFI